MSSRDSGAGAEVVADVNEEEVSDRSLSLPRPLSLTAKGKRTDRYEITKIHGHLRLLHTLTHTSLQLYRTKISLGPKITISRHFSIQRT